MSARISSTLIGIQGVRRKFALWKALCLLLVWWFPICFKVFETGYFLRLSRARERPGSDVVWCCSPPLPSDGSGILCHIGNVTLCIDQEELSLCRSQGRIQIPPFFKHEFCILNCVDSWYLPVCGCPSSCPPISGCCEVIHNRMLPWCW